MRAGNYHCTQPESAKNAIDLDVCQLLGTIFKIFLAPYSSSRHYQFPWIQIGAAPTIFFSFIIIFIIIVERSPVSTCWLKQEAEAASVRQDALANRLL